MGKTIELGVHIRRVDKQVDCKSCIRDTRSYYQYVVNPAGSVKTAIA